MDSGESSAGLLEYFVLNVEWPRSKFTDLETDSTRISETFLEYLGING